MMDRRYRIIFGILGFMGLWLFFSGCGDQSKPPPRPKVIKKKIVIKKTEPGLLEELHELQAKRNLITSRIAVIKKQLGMQTNQSLTTY